MRRIVILAAALPLAILAAACAPISVSSQVDRGVNFARYQTFAWAPPDALPVGDPRLDNNPFFQDYLSGAIERGLERHSIVFAQNAANADLLVHYHASVVQRLDVAGHGAVTPGYWEPQVVKEDESTITVDLIDARTNRLVWRGWAQDSLQAFVDDQDAMRAHVRRSIEKMFAQLPL